MDTGTAPGTTSPLVPAGGSYFRSEVLEMECVTCDRSAAWHRRRMEHLEETEGPRAVLDFEAAHPEVESE